MHASRHKELCDLRNSIAHLFGEITLRRPAGEKQAAHANFRGRDRPGTENERGVNDVMKRLKQIKAEARHA